MVEPLSQEDKDRIWTSFSKAIGTEPREAKSIMGASGLEHPVQAISVDDRRGRVVVVVSEPNPRTAALVQTDIQATISDAQVLVARPVVIDFAAIARKVFSTADRAILDLPKIQQVCQRVNKLPERRKRLLIERRIVPNLAPFISAINNVSLPGLAQFIDIIQQAAHLDWKAMVEQVQAPGPGHAPVSLARMFEIDNLAIDRSHGVCPLPLYNFSEGDWQSFCRGTDIEDAQERLKAMGIYQFFFPSPDQLALGVVEKGLSKPQDVIAAVERAPRLGHPLSKNDLIQERASIPEVLEGLKDIGYVAEGEHGIEETSEGRTIRSIIRFKPQESVFQRLLNRFSMSVSVSPKDFMGPH